MPVLQRRGGNILHFGPSEDGPATSTATPSSSVTPEAQSTGTNTQARPEKIAQEEYDTSPSPPSVKVTCAPVQSQPQVQEQPVKRRSKRRNGFIFTLGGIFGVFLALFFANQNEVISLDALTDLNLDALIDVIPAGILNDAKEFSVGLLCRCGYSMANAM